MFHKVTLALKKNSIQEKNLKEIQKENEILKKQAMSFLRNFKAKIEEQKMDSTKKATELHTLPEVSIPLKVEENPQSKLHDMHQLKEHDFDDKLKVFTEIVAKI